MLNLQIFIYVAMLSVSGFWLITDFIEFIFKNFDEE